MITYVGMIRLELVKESRQKFDILSQSVNQYKYLMTKTTNTHGNTKIK